MAAHTYLLHNHDWSCSICPSLGINIIALRHRGFPILREPNDTSELLTSPVLFGLPLLLPPNRTSGGKFIFDNKEYMLPVNEPAHGNHLHGLMHSAPFEVLSHTQSALRSRLINHGEYFPFAFQIDITDQLCEDGLIRTLDITNIGQSNMPLTIGFHATFTQPQDFSVPIGKRWAVNEHHIPTGDKLPLTPTQHTYRDGCVLSGQRINGFYEAVGNTARIGDYRFTVDGFDQWILFNGDGKQNYLCVEPQLGPVNALNSGTYPILEKGKTYRLTLRITSVKQ